MPDDELDEHARFIREMADAERGERDADAEFDRILEHLRVTLSGEVRLDARAPCGARASPAGHPRCGPVPADSVAPRGGIT